MLGRFGIKVDNLEILEYCFGFRFQNVEHDRSLSISWLIGEVDGAGDGQEHIRDDDGRQSEECYTLRPHLRSDFPSPVSIVADWF